MLVLQCRFIRDNGKTWRDATKASVDRVHWPDRPPAASGDGAVSGGHGGPRGRPPDLLQLTGARGLQLHRHGALQACSGAGLRAGGPVAAEDDVDQFAAGSAAKGAAEVGVGEFEDRLASIFRPTLIIVVAVAAAAHESAAGDFRLRKSGSRWSLYAGGVQS